MSANHTDESFSISTDRTTKWLLLNLIQLFCNQPASQLIQEGGGREDLHLHGNGVQEFRWIKALPLFCFFFFFSHLICYIPHLDPFQPTKSVQPAALDLNPESTGYVSQQQQEKLSKSEKEMDDIKSKREKNVINAAAELHSFLAALRWERSDGLFFCYIVCDWVGSAEREGLSTVLSTTPCACTWKGRV